MGSSETFCLRWNDFQENISVAFRELRDDSDFFDVTLACPLTDDASKSLDPTTKTRHKTIKAHKVILSACSVFFKDLLKSLNTGSNQTQQFIYLRGIKYEDLKNILDFMYYGQVNIAQDELNTFLAVAEELRVKGLSPHETGQGGSGPDLPAKRPFVPNRTLSNFNPKRSKFVNKKNKDDSMEIKMEMREGSPESKEPDFGGESSSAAGSGSQFHSTFVDQFSSDRSMDDYAGDDYIDPMNDGATGGETAEGNKEYYDVDDDDDDSNVPPFDGADYKAKIRTLIKIDLATNLPYCNICNQTGSSYETVANHIEARHIQRREYACQYCGKTFKTKNHKAVHIHRVHREEHKLAKVFGPSVGGGAV